MALGTCPHGPTSAGEMVERRFPGEERLGRQPRKKTPRGAWFATTEGTPQGGIASPALANWTLDGLQRLLTDHCARTPKQQRMNKVHLVRYADDFLITGTSKELLRDQVQPLVAHFLKERGLELSHEKTR